MAILDLLREIRDLEKKQLHELVLIRQALTYRLPRPPADVFVSINPVAEETEGNVATIVFEVTLKDVEDTPNNKDVISRKIITFVDGAETNTQEVPRDVNQIIVKVAQNATGKLRASYIDDAGNESAATDSAEFVAVDTIPPDAPGADFAQIVAVGEEE